MVVEAGLLWDNMPASNMVLNLRNSIPETNRVVDMLLHRRAYQVLNRAQFPSSVSLC